MAAPCSKSIRGAAVCRLRNIRVRGVKKMTKLAWGAAAAALVAATPALGADASQSTFGKMPDGRSVPAVTLTNGNGLSATVIALGPTLQSVVMHDRDAKQDDVALGSDNPSDYNKAPPSFGSHVGRFPHRT